MTKAIVPRERVNIIVYDAAGKARVLASRRTDPDGQGVDIRQAER